ncbi:hypothetical protein BDR03DRAFT_975953 [Suillus americanus]|nr:hypothetical protein BDR03DRAFT_975953 [Suillus americanus]
MLNASQSNIRKSTASSNSNLSRTSLTLYILTIPISFFISRMSTLAHSFAIMRDNARLHTPSFSSLSGHCHSRSCHETHSSHFLFFSFFISSMSVSATPWNGFFLRMGEILPSTHRRFLSDSRSSNRLFAPQAR